MRSSLVAVAVAALVMPTIVHADWQYARWGMSK